MPIKHRNKDALTKRQEAAILATEREQAQKDTKIQARYGGLPHGRRPQDQRP